MTMHLALVCAAYLIPLVMLLRHQPRHAVAADYCHCGQRLNEHSAEFHAVLLNEETTR